MDAKLQELCRQAHEDRIRVGMLDTDTKNRTLELAADALMAHEQEILEANAIDMERGRERNMPQGLLDRLKLDHDRLLGMADGLRQVAKLEDPIGEVMSMRKRPNGLIIGKVRVAIGVVGIIFYGFQKEFPTLLHIFIIGKCNNTLKTVSVIGSTAPL